MQVTINSTVLVFGGRLFRCTLNNAFTLGGLNSNFSVFLPCLTDAAGETHLPVHKFPQIYWLSGLTCTDENFVSKAGAFKYAVEQQVALVMPDTSPRGANIEGEADSWDFGLGAGFYVDATQPKWSKHYNMYSFIVKELFDAVNNKFHVNPARVSVMGHSMGGHGALVLALRNSHIFHSVSAFAPICNPMNVPWGQKAFGNYLGSSEEDKKTWSMYDASYLAEHYAENEESDGDCREMRVLVDQGSADSFLTNQLKPEALQEAVNKNESGKLSLQLNIREGYDHSYYFISTFIEDHIKFHANILKR